MSRFAVRAVFFDLDGTLLDSLPGIESSIAAACAACGVRIIHSDVRAVIGPPIRSILSSVTGVEDTGKLDDLERAFRLDYDSVGWVNTPVYPAAGRVLQELANAAVPLFVVSNKPHHVAVRILQRQGIMHHFQKVVTRDSRNPAYPGKVDMLQAILDTEGYAESCCVMVGDTIEDALAAESLGLRFIYMAHGYGLLSNEQMSRVKTAESLPELLELLENIGDR